MDRPTLPSAPTTKTAAGSWRSAWMDALAFAGGLAVAWWRDWQTTDLVWSLWLSSLVVGYAILVWHISRPLRELVVGLAGDRELARSRLGVGLGVLVVLGGSLFMLAFFTVHFGGFHVGHSVFLNNLFPVGAAADPAPRGFPGWTVYGEVVRRYWVFVPLALLAERQAFRPVPPRSAETAVTAAAIVRRRRRPAGGEALFAPYKNVIRMHLLIFFFAAAHALELHHFGIYATVYAVYFFPWHLLRAAGRCA